MRTPWTSQPVGRPSRPGRATRSPFEGIDPTSFEGIDPISSGTSAVDWNRSATIADMVEGSGDACGKCLVESDAVIPLGTLACSRWSWLPLGPPGCSWRQRGRYLESARVLSAQPGGEAHKINFEQGRGGSAAPPRRTVHQGDQFLQRIGLYCRAGILLVMAAAVGVSARSLPFFVAREDRVVNGMKPLWS